MLASVRRLQKLSGITAPAAELAERFTHAGFEVEGIRTFGKDLEKEVYAALGAPLKNESVSLEDEVLDISVTPNRPDVLGHWGLARELCALWNRPFAPQEPSLPTPDISGKDALQIELADGQRCSLYAASLVEGLEPGTSPFWLRYELHKLGLRSIQNIVDVTNWILFEYGHPIHAFDANTICGPTIVVRCAKKGEHLITLDGATRVLHEDDLVIADANRPVALAGVMGGKETEVTHATKRILIECAVFDARSVRRTARRHGLHTDASHRFERGVDFADTDRVLAHATEMIRTLANGKHSSEKIETKVSRSATPPIALRPQRIEKLLGVSVADVETQNILERLGCSIQKSNVASWQVQSPSWRPDLLREADLIEEVARVRGYASIPTELPALRVSEDRPSDPLRSVAQRIRQGAIALALDEAINYSFLAKSDLEAAGAPLEVISLANPLSVERSVMRTSLLPGLLANARHAVHRQVADVRLFEIGRTYHPSPDAIHEKTQLAVLLVGQRAAWIGEGEPVDFYDIKGVLESLVNQACGLKLLTQFLGSANEAPFLHPLRAAQMVVEKTSVGVLGELHPDIRQAYGLSGSAVFAYLDLATLLKAQSVQIKHTVTLPKYPSASRDVAFLVSEEVKAGEVMEDLLRHAQGLIEDIRIFDVYRGEGIDKGYKSLAFRIIYRDKDATWTDERVEEIHRGVVQSTAKKFQAVLRS